MEEILLRPIIKAPTPTDKSKKQTWQHKNATKNTSIEDWLRKVSWNNDSHPTIPVWLNQFTGSQPSHLPQNLCNQKDTHLNIFE